MERAAQRLLALFVIVANRPAAVHTAVRECLDLVFRHPDHQKGQLGNIVDERVADILDFILWQAICQTRFQSFSTSRSCSSFDQ